MNLGKLQSKFRGSRVFDLSMVKALQVQYSTGSGQAYHLKNYSPRSRILCKESLRLDVNVILPGNNVSILGGLDTDLTAGHV